MLSTIRKWFRARGHFQNLNEDSHGKVKGSILRHGRMWFLPFGYGEKRGLEFRAEWSTLTNFWALQFEVGSGDGDDGLSLWIAFGLLSLHLSLDGVLPRRVTDWGRRRALATNWMGYEYMAWPRKTGIRIFGNSIWFEIWNWDHGWSRDQPKWLSFSFNVADFLFGPTRFLSKDLTYGMPRSAGLLMQDEGVYPLSIKLTEDTWKRDRWPWPQSMKRAHIECLRPIPIPGKGENSWDCGDDATHSLTCPATTVEEAVEVLRELVMQSRERYGGKNWKPDLSSAA